MRKTVLLSLMASIAAAATAWAATTPAVVTGAATAVSNSGALLHATVNPGGAATTYNFEYGPTIAYGETSKTGQAGGGTKAVSVMQAIGNLTPGTLYHYRIEAANKLGSAVGGDRTFTTTGYSPPQVVTDLARGVGKTMATLEGTIVSQNEATNWLFEWGTSTAYGEQTFGAVVSPILGPSYVSYTLTGLAPGTTFHYRLVAAHAGSGPQSGLDQAFTTIPLKRWRAKVTARTMPRRARHRPYRFITSGTVVPRVALPPGVGCTGAVRVRFLFGHRTVAFRKAMLQSNCAFSTEVAFRHLIDHTSTRLRIVVRFSGNAYLRPASAQTRRVRLG